VREETTKGRTEGGFFPRLHAFSGPADHRSALQGDAAFRGFRAFRSSSSPSALRLHPSGFSLIELLVVIAIIGILVTIITGAVQSVVRDRKIAHAKSEVQAIAMAAEEYYRTYREIPVATNWYDPTADNNNELFFSINTRQGTSGTTNRSGNYAIAAQFYDILSGTNGIGKAFLSITRVDGAGGNAANGVLLDPWRKPYAIYFDSNYDGVIGLNLYKDNAAMSGVANTAGASVRKDARVFVRSSGPNGIVDIPNTRQSDDITWPPMDTIW
jgi:prepilin-type N-terminal cleavage/methylation domain-containing protein